MLLELVPGSRYSRGCLGYCLDCASRNTCNKLVPKGAEQLAHYLNCNLGRSLLRVLANPGRSLGAHN